MKAIFMADVMRSDSADSFSCDVCTEVYDNNNHQPKLLACHHSCCKSCLMQMAKTQDGIECPSCRRLTRLPQGGVTALQTNFYITQLQDVLKTMKTQKTRGCKKHHYQYKSFYCQKCNIAICRDCTVLDHKEADGHKVQDLEEAENEQREILSSQLCSARKMSSEIYQHLLQLERERERVATLDDDIQQSIEDTFSGYIDMLEIRKNELQDELKYICRKKNARINHAIQIINPKLNEFKTMLVNANQKKSSSIVSIIQAKCELTQACHDLQSVVNMLTYDNENLQYDATRGQEEFKAAVAGLGALYIDETVPVSSEIILPELTASIPATAKITVYSASGSELTGDDIEVTIMDDHGDLLQLHLMWNGTKGSFKFIPQVSGKIYVRVKYGNQFISGANVIAQVESNDPVAKFGQYGNGQGSFHSPRAIAINAKGELYIADSGNKLIQKMDHDGSFIHQFDISNGMPEKSTYDLALCSDDSRVVCTEVVLDKMSNPLLANTILNYTNDGEHRGMFTNESMKCALCIASNRRNEIIVSDYRCHSLFMHDCKGNFLRKIGNEGTFNHPTFICVADDDSIIVSDTNTHTIQIFNQDGCFLRQIGKAGRGKGELKQPFGVACDGEFILMVDSGNNRIQIFTKNGTFISTIESHGDPMNQPRGLAITRDGHLYVADRDNHCIKKFRYKLEASNEILNIETDDYYIL